MSWYLHNYFKSQLLNQCSLPSLPISSIQLAIEQVLAHYFQQVFFCYLRGRCSALCTSCEGKSWKVMLSSPTCPVLEALGKKLSFEIAVGLNGRVWVKADSPSTVIIVVNAIIKSESLSGAQQKIMAEKLLQKIQND
ncbi:hypothetical protein POPTR_015G075400v4 [Populus trichocarpa]|uniref:Uncharacterized protein n=2 Tax=Populus trichocarpa TaxID=3694 RepID=A0ACC0RVG3_POPTR|nr:hypothetical protein POPTR_015G075400v4 [Populus trichocarpa]